MNFFSRLYGKLLNVIQSSMRLGEVLDEAGLMEALQSINPEDPENTKSYLLKNRIGATRVKKILDETLRERGIDAEVLVLTPNILEIYISHE